MTRNQASGGVSVSVARSQARRHSAADEPGRAAAGYAARAAGRALALLAVVVPSGAMSYPVIWVQALTHCWNGTQSFLPLPHCASGVFQNLIVWKYDSGAFAW